MLQLVVPYPVGSQLQFNRLYPEASHPNGDLSGMGLPQYGVGGPFGWERNCCGKACENLENLLYEYGGSDFSKRRIGPH